MARHVGTNELIRDGCVYVLQNDALGPDVFKIGMTTSDPVKRAAALGKQLKKIPGGLSPKFAQRTKDACQLESRVHHELRNYRLPPDHPISVQFGLEHSIEFFHRLTFKKVESAIVRSLEGLEVEDSWCNRLRENPQMIFEIEEVEGKLFSDSPRVQYWIDKLATNGNKAVAEFTLMQIAKNVKDTAGKTSYLTWKFEGKSRAWFDPTYPRAASNFIHRRFDGDIQHWKKRLGTNAVLHEYRNSTELRLTLWTAKHMKAMRTMVETIMPKVHFLT